MRKILLNIAFILILFPALAHSLPLTVTVSFDILDSEIYVGDQFSVNLVADIYESVAGFGLDLSYDTGLLDLASLPVIGPAWTPLFAMDGDSLAGLAPFSFPVIGLKGLNILLATFTFDAISAGASYLNASKTLEGFMEGFPFPGPPGSFAGVDFRNTTVTVLEAAPVPEPTTLILLSTGLVALMGFRFYRKS